MVNLGRSGDRVSGRTSMSSRMVRSQTTASRTTFEQAVELYPDEWVIFAEPRLDEASGRFIDGLVFFHDPDEAKALSKARKLRASGGGAIFFTGDPHYRKLTLRADARR